MVHGFSEDNTITRPGDVQISLNNSLKKVPSTRGATCILRHTEDGQPDLKLRVDHKGTSAAKTDGHTGTARQIATGLIQDANILCMGIYSLAITTNSPCNCKAAPPTSPDRCEVRRFCPALDVYTGLMMRAGVLDICPYLSAAWYNPRRRLIKYK